MPKLPSPRHGRAPQRPILLQIPEAVLAILTTPESLLGEDGDDDVEPGLELRIEEAAQEIAQALLETGRQLRHLHLLREALDRRGARRGYREGVVAAASVLSAVGRDLKELRRVRGSRPPDRAPAG